MPEGPTNVPAEADSKLISRGSVTKVDSVGSDNKTDSVRYEELSVLER